MHMPQIQEYHLLVCIKLVCKDVQNQFVFLMGCFNKYFPKVTQYFEWYMGCFPLRLLRE